MSLPEVNDVGEMDDVLLNEYALRELHENLKRRAASAKGDDPPPKDSKDPPPKAKDSKDPPPKAKDPPAKESKDPPPKDPPPKDPPPKDSNDPAANKRPAKPDRSPDPPPAAAAPATPGLPLTITVTEVSTSRILITTPSLVTIFITTPIVISNPRITTTNFITAPPVTATLTSTVLVAGPAPPPITRTLISTAIIAAPPATVAVTSTVVVAAPAPPAITTTFISTALISAPAAPPVTETLISSVVIPASAVPPVTQSLISTVTVEASAPPPVTATLITTEFITTFPVISTAFPSPSVSPFDPTILPSTTSVQPFETGSPAALSSSLPPLPDAPFTISTTAPAATPTLTASPANNPPNETAIIASVASVIGIVLVGLLFFCCVRRSRRNQTKSSFAMMDEEASKTKRFSLGDDLKVARNYVNAAPGGASSWSSIFPTWRKTSKQPRPRPRPRAAELADTSLPYRYPVARSALERFEFFRTPREEHGSRFMSEPPPVPTLTGSRRPPVRPPRSAHNSTSSRTGSPVRPASAAQPKEFHKKYNVNNPIPNEDLPHALTTPSSPLFRPDTYELAAQRMSHRTSSRSEARLSHPNSNEY